MAATQDLTLGLAADINTAGIGVYDPARIWTVDDTEVAVVFDGMPQTPDRCIVTAGYKLGGDDPAHPSGAWNVQFRVRGAAYDQASVDDISDALYDLFHGLTDRAYGSVHVTQSELVSSIPMGMDDNHRWERSGNYRFDLDLPATVHRSYQHS